MRRAASILVLALMVLGAVAAASALGRPALRTQTTTFKAQLSADGCGRTPSFSHRFDGVVGHFRLLQPRAGTPLENQVGTVIGRIASVKMEHRGSDTVRVTWKGSAVMPCVVIPPRPVLPEVPKPSLLSVPTVDVQKLSGSATERAEFEAERKAAEEVSIANSTAETRYRGEVEARQRQEYGEEENWEGQVEAAKREWKLAWGLQAHPQTGSLKFEATFLHRPPGRHAGGPIELCEDFQCEAVEAVEASLRRHYEAPLSTVSCEALSQDEAHCYFTATTKEDIDDGAGLEHRKGESYVTRFPDGLDVEVIRFQ